MRGLLRPTLAVVIVLLVGAAAAPAMAADTYDIAAPDALDAPYRTVTFQDESYPVDGTLVTNPDAANTVEVTAPDESYRVSVYDSSEQIVEERSGDGSETFTFDFEGYAVGSYLLVVTHDGDVEDVLPVVVRGYAVAHDAPETAEPGESVEVSVDVTRTIPEDPPNAVTVVVADGESAVREEATRRSDGSYIATVSLTDLDAGTYSVWALAECTVDAFGHIELEGMSAPSTVELVEPARTGDAGGSGSGDAASTDTAAPTEATPAASATAEPTESPTSTDTTTPDSSTSDVVTTGTASQTDAGGPVDATVAVGLLVAATVGGLLWRRF